MMESAYRPSGRIVMSISVSGKRQLHVLAERCKKEMKKEKLGKYGPGRESPLTSSLRKGNENG
jgi:hypothetical protein